MAAVLSPVRVLPRRSSDKERRLASICRGRVVSAIRNDEKALSLARLYKDFKPAQKFGKEGQGLIQNLSGRLGLRTKVTPKEIRKALRF